MCLILFSHKSHPTYKLIVAANRDEFYQRKTKPAEFWEDHPDILAGRDLEAGGTWMGVNKKGEMSMLTNFRDLKNIKENAPSRGKLVSDFLVNDQTPKAYMQGIAPGATKYNGFNMICGNLNELWYYGNYQQGIHLIKPGIHGLSNALLDTPWPKVEKGKQKLTQIIQRPFQVEDVFELLYDDIKAPTNQLPDTGVGLTREEMLSPIFIKSEGYGSRCSTILLIDHNDHMTFVERTYNPNDFSYFDKSFHLAITQ